MAPEVLILARADEGEALAQSVKGAGFRARVVGPTVRPSEAIDGSPPLAVLIDARAYADPHAATHAVRAFREGGLHCVLLVAEGVPPVLPLAELRAALAAAAGPSNLVPIDASGVGVEDGELGLGLDLARRIDQVVGEAMADLVGEVVREVLPTLPAEALATAPPVAGGEPEILLDLEARVREADYFEILGLSRGASADAIQSAWREAREALAGTIAGLPEVVRAELQPRVEDVMAVLLEARTVLEEDGLRAAYAAALRG